jgi:hypothetical protein
LLSSHILSEAEALSDRVTIIRHGRTVETGTLADMRHLTTVSVEAELRASAALDGMPGVRELAVTGTVVRCRVDHAALDAVVGRLHQAGIRSLTCRPPTLEELFLRHYSPERSPAGSSRFSAMAPRCPRASLASLRCWPSPPAISRCCTRPPPVGSRWREEPARTRPCDSSSVG